MADARVQHIKKKFEIACRAIDARSAELEHQMMRDAMTALLAGDAAERTRIIETRLSAMERARHGAKVEAWVRAGAEIGMDEDALRRQAETILARQ